jgi:hypothetical protein
MLEGLPVSCIAKFRDLLERAGADITSSESFQTNSRFAERRVKGVISSAEILCARQIDKQSFNGSRVY